MRTKYSNKRPLCKCGCGCFVEWNKWRHKWNEYLVGHIWKGKTGPNKGRKFSEQSKLKMSKASMGMKHSKEAKRKISQALTGTKRSYKFKEKVSKFHKGKTISIKQRLKLSKALTGRKLSGETKRKISLSKIGKNNPSWKGGISCEPYCQDWTKEYKEYIKERDNNICQNPNCRHNCDGKTPHVHHIDYNKKNCVPKNLITLCGSCNSRANFNREQHTKFYQEIIKHKYELKEAA